MRKVIVLVLCMVCLFAGISYALYSQEMIFNEGIETEATLTSSAIPIGTGTDYACWIHATHNVGNGADIRGKSNLRIWPEYSPTSSSADFAKLRVFNLLVNTFTSTVPTVFPMTPVTAKFMRFIVEGVKDGIDTGNTTNTTITMYLMKQDG